ncbi:unnamed protein product, partial [Rotaria sp. Silwood1]
MTNSNSNDINEEEQKKILPEITLEKNEQEEEAEEDEEAESLLEQTVQQSGEKQRKEKFENTNQTE